MRSKSFRSWSSRTEIWSVTGLNLDETGLILVGRADSRAVFRNSKSTGHACLDHFRRLVEGQVPHGTPQYKSHRHKPPQHRPRPTSHVSGFLSPYEVPEGECQPRFSVTLSPNPELCPWTQIRTCPKMGTARNEFGWKRLRTQSINQSINQASNQAIKQPINQPHNQRDSDKQNWKHNAHGTKHTKCTQKKNIEH